ncbi:MAG: hypothetical protein AB8H03_00370 [Saprospiraceae bacterium]
MKKYFVRKIGWVYDDARWNNDGAHQFVESFTSKEEAIEVKQKLNREYFITVFDWIHEYTTWSIYDKDYQEIKDSVNDYLINELSCNPTIRLYPDNSEYSNLRFLQKPTNTQLDELIKRFRISFFQISEFDKKNNLTFINAIFSGDYNYSSEYLTDYDGNINLLFTSKYEAMDRFKKEKIDEYIYEEKIFFLIHKHTLLKDKLENLSSFPDIIKDFISTNKHISYLDEQIIIQPRITTESLLQLNSLLKKPFLIFEEKEINESDFVQDNFASSILEESEDEWKYIQERNDKFNSIEELKNSKDYLLSCGFQLIDRYHRLNYFRILKKHFIKHFNEEEIIKHGGLRYKEKVIGFLGVIKELEIIDGNYFLKSTFWMNDYTNFNIDKIGLGSGTTILLAFEDSLEDWLTNYLEDCIQTIKKEF